MYLGENVVREKEYRSAIAETRLLGRIYELIGIDNSADGGMRNSQSRLLC